MGNLSNKITKFFGNNGVSHVNFKDKNNNNIKVKLKLNKNNTVEAIYKGYILMTYNKDGDIFKKAIDFEEYFSTEALVEISFHMYKFYKSTAG